MVEASLIILNLRWHMYLFILLRSRIGGRLPLLQEKEILGVETYFPVHLRYQLYGS